MGQSQPAKNSWCGLQTSEGLGSIQLCSASTKRNGLRSLPIFIHSILNIIIILLLLRPIKRVRVRRFEHSGLFRAHFLRSRRIQFSHRHWILRETGINSRFLQLSWSNIIGFLLIVFHGSLRITHFQMQVLTV